MPPRIPVRWVALAILVVVALGLLRSRGAHPAQLATSCTTPGMKLSASQLSRASNVAFSAVGPSGGRYVITLDTQSLHRGAAGELMVEAEPRMAESARVLGDEFDMTGCRHNGRIPFFAGPGVAHTLQMFRVDGTPRGPYGGVSVEVDG